jgi:hypothetical protein
MENTSGNKSASPEFNSITGAEIERFQGSENNLGELFEAYLNTNYVVEDRGLELIIRIAEKNSDADNLFTESSVQGGAFLTAYNPYSQELSRSENESRQKELIDFLNEEDYEFFYGYGEGEDGQWKPEPSLFILGIDFQKAFDLARRFEQNAFVYVEKGKAPILISCAQQPLWDG